MTFLSTIKAEKKKKKIPLKFESKRYILNLFTAPHRDMCGIVMGSQPALSHMYIVYPTNVDIHDFIGAQVQIKIRITIANVIFVYRSLSLSCCL